MSFEKIILKKTGPPDGMDPPAHINMPAISQKKVLQEAVGTECSALGSLWKEISNIVLVQYIMPLEYHKH